MATTTKTVTQVTCDSCGTECKRSDAIIDFPVSGGDGRDVGPTKIKGTIRLYQPYGVADGDLCHACLYKFLSLYMKTLSADLASKAAEGK